MNNLSEQDFKYVIQDFSQVYIGARYSYEELVDSDDTPGRFQDAICRVFYKEVSPDTTIWEHLLALKEDSLGYLAFSQLRIHIKITALRENMDKKGKKKASYETKDLSLQEFMADERIKQEPDQYLIQEISFKKRHLMMMHV